MIKGVRVTVRDNDRGMRELLNELRGLGDMHVVAGIRGEMGAQVDPDSGMTVVQYATVNEFGSALAMSDQGIVRGIPERSFMRSAFDENREKYKQRLVTELRRLLKSKADGPRKPSTKTSKRKPVAPPTGARDLLARMGLRMARDIQMKIRRGPFVPNAPMTIRMKGSSKPLIDSGRMRQSIDSEVRNGRVPRRARGAR